MKHVLLVGALVATLGLPAALLAQAAQPAQKPQPSPTTQKPQTSSPAPRTQTAPRSQSANPPAAGSTLGSVTLRTKASANGQALAAGTYQVRLTADEPKPGVGQSPNAERYVEFVRGGKVVAREVATVIPQSEIGQIAKGPRPPAGGSRVDTLKGNDYVRVWINRGGMNYLIHLPTS
jgi:hypothetical protein